MLENCLTRDSCGRLKWENNFKNNFKNRHLFLCCYSVEQLGYIWGLWVFCFFSYRHQLQLASYSGRRSDWPGCLLPGPHSDGVSCGRPEPISPRRSGPPPESAVPVSFLRWPPPPVWVLTCKNTRVRGQTVDISTFFQPDCLNSLHSINLNPLIYCTRSLCHWTGTFDARNLQSMSTIQLSTTSSL